MNILLDESAPYLIKTSLPKFKIKTVKEMGWAGLRNGDLFRKAEDQFHVFITADKNLRYQQNLSSRKMAIILLPTNRVPDVVSLLPTLEQFLKAVKPGTFLEIPWSVL